MAKLLCISLSVLFYGFVLAVKVVEGCEAIRVKVRLWYYIVLPISVGVLSSN